jgi:hypothetical protein
VSKGFRGRFSFCSLDGYVKMHVQHGLWCVISEKIGYDQLNSREGDQSGLTHRITKYKQLALIGPSGGI